MAQSTAAHLVDNWGAYASHMGISYIRRVWPWWYHVPRGGCCGLHTGRVPRLGCLDKD